MTERISVTTITCSECGALLDLFARQEDAEEIDTVNRIVGWPFASCDSCPRHPFGRPVWNVRAHTDIRSWATSARIWPVKDIT